MDDGDTKSGDYANAKRAYDTAKSDTQACTVDGREHLTGENASDDAPTNLQDDVQDAGKLGRPVAHEISTYDL